MKATQYCFVIYARHADMDIDAVHHRPADAFLVFRDGCRRAGARPGRVPVVPERAGMYTIAHFCGGIIGSGDDFDIWNVISLNWQCLLR